ncbi:MAG: hypothetical protein WBA45_17910 [Microthrixaceae bacterium]
MALDVTTKDCTALSDSELAEMADICAEGGHCYEVGELSKQVDLWVLVTLVREGNHLRGFSFSTLERIGGTPCILLGVASVKRTSKRDSVLRAIIGDNFRRALMAFPDEDVLLGTRLSDAGAFDGFKQLSDVIPRPGHKASGEERAWGRRLAKRFGIDSGSYDDQKFTIVGEDCPPLVLDHESLKPESIDADVAAQFSHLDSGRGDCLVACGWVMAEELLKHG